MRSSIPGRDRKNSSQDLKSCVVYSLRGTIFGPLQVERCVQSLSPHFLLRGVSLQVQVSLGLLSG